MKPKTKVRCTVCFMRGGKWPRDAQWTAGSLLLCDNHARRLEEMLVRYVPNEHCWRIKESAT